MFSQLYLTGAVYSLDGSDSLKETMQTSIAATDKVTAECTVYQPTGHIHDYCIGKNKD